MKPLFLLLVFLPIGTIALNAEDSVLIIFQRIEVDSRPASLIWIASYGEAQNWNPLSKNSARFVVQPMGVISTAYEVDFQSGRFFVFPGTHSKESASEFKLPPKEIEKLRLLLTSDRFLRLPSRNHKIGRGGTSYFIEADIEGDYRWVLHWSPDDSIMREIFELTAHMERNYNKE